MTNTIKPIIDIMPQMTVSLLICGVAEPKLKPKNNERLP